MATESPYVTKLRDPRFKLTEQAVFERDGRMCFDCGSRSELQVRHVVYRKLDPWDYKLDLYVVTCKKCLEVRTALMDSVIDAIRVKFKDVPNSKLRGWVTEFLVDLEKC